MKSWARLALLALVLLLALKVWQFARLHLTGPHSSKRQLFRWYLFLAVKTALLLIAALMAALDLVHAAVIGSQSASGYSLGGLAAIWFFLFGANMALTWSIRDQLDRCRVCLKGLGMHVNLGSASHILLESNGTEWMCDEGHGALHLPVMESGSVDSERWSYLDDSWRVLLGNRETRITASS